MMFEVYQRNDLLIERTLKDEDGTALDLSGAELFFDVETGNAEILSKDLNDGITITDATNGVIEIDITSTDTDIDSGSYQCELLIIDSNNNRYSTLDTDFVVKNSLTKDKE